MRGMITVPLAAAAVAAAESVLGGADPRLLYMLRCIRSMARAFLQGWRLGATL